MHGPHLGLCPGRDVRVFGVGNVLPHPPTPNLPTQGRKVQRSVGKLLIPLTRVVLLRLVGGIAKTNKGWCFVDAHATLANSRKNIQVGGAFAASSTEASLSCETFFRFQRAIASFKSRASLDTKTPRHQGTRTPRY